VSIIERTAAPASPIALVPKSRSPRAARRERVQSPSRRHRRFAQQSGRYHAGAPDPAGTVDKDVLVSIEAGSGGVG
jgi:hypothetical protein